jgi:hypothetical protein
MLRLAVTICRMTETFCQLMESLWKKKCNKTLLKKLACEFFCFLKYFIFSPFKQDMQCTHKRNKEARSCNHCCSGKVVIITYCDWVYLQPHLFSTQSARAVCYRHRWPLCLYRICPQLSHKRQDFRESFEHKMYVLILSKTCLKHLWFLKESSEILS